MNDEQLILKLSEIEAVKFGTFTLKSGIVSPIYIDLRVIISYPTFLEAVAEKIWRTINRNHFDILCGVPYTALPIATAMSIAHSKPMILRRKEVKNYGTKKAIEGNYSEGQVCMVVEDLVTSGSSTLETIKALEHEGLIVSDAAVLIDREQGGMQNVKNEGYTLHAALTLTKILQTLEHAGKVDSQVVSNVKTFIQENQTQIIALA